MKVEVCYEPVLGEYIRVALSANEDQREHFTAMTGQPWDVDSVAIGAFQTIGPKWCIRIDDKPVAIGGFAQQRPGVYRDWFIFTPEAFEPRNYVKVTRICRKLMDAVLQTCHRIECVAPAARVAGSPKLERWYRILGYNKEALLYGYCASGADAVCYSRVRH